jgi:hypothetical protein
MGENEKANAGILTLVRMFIRGRELKNHHEAQKPIPDSYRDGNFENETSNWFRRREYVIRHRIRNEWCIDGTRCERLGVT